MAEESHDSYEIKKVPGSSAWTSSTSDGCIININPGMQGHVVKDVSGDDFMDVHVGSDFIYGENKILLPRFVVLKANDGKCLRLTKNDDGAFPAGFLKFEGREVASPEAKFELETAKSGHKLVHIRCCYNNKYLVRSGTTGWIVAGADKPEENKSKISCTVFELEPVNKSGGLEFQFRHIQRGMHACLWRCWKSPHGIQFHGGLSVGTNAHDAYTAVAWESLVKKMNKAVVLPKFVALKGMNNNKYLSLTTKNEPRLPAGFLLLDGEEVASPLAKFEIEIAKSENRLVHIRCCDNNKYLVRENTTICACYHCHNNVYWIVAAADKPEEDEYKISCTLFEPELYNESGGSIEFRFRHIQLGMGTYACMQMRTHSPVHGGLYGGSNVPNKDACDVYTVVDLNG